MNATNFFESKNHDQLTKPTKGDDLLPANCTYCQGPTFTVKSTTQLILVMLLVITSLAGNSTICILMKRFKMIRTIPNMFLANLAIVDILNILTNMPFFIIVGVFELNQTLHGRVVSLLVALAQTFFNILKIMSTLATMMDRLIAITWGLKHYVRKTRTKAAKAICAAWLVSMVMVLPWVMASSKIDLGDAPTYTYRMVYFDKFGKDSAFFFFLIFGLVFTVLSLMTCFSFKRKVKGYTKQRKEHNIDRKIALEKARIRNEAKATWTIGLTVVAYVLSYVPCIIYSVFTNDREDMTKTSEAKWFGFAANYFLFTSSACNPFIYVARTNRFRKTIKQLLKTPCGSSAK
ncbi:adenosine receptor A2b-like [Actinia tenebrosa]|uniref:Adenosine receptor A2b-like n=1 Tax=Actinia tenebrosa TaxID=6105 RepID=A0A6P8HPM4_ACTTE|nr:adenosine receptor A2b-like [Actinia tenebrosa]